MILSTIRYAYEERLSRNLLEQPISPERLSSRTQGYPSIATYINFSRSGTDSKEFISPEMARRQKYYQISPTPTVLSITFVGILWNISQKMDKVNMLNKEGRNKEPNMTLELRPGLCGPFQLQHLGIPYFL